MDPNQHSVYMFVILEQCWAVSPNMGSYLTNFSLAPKAAGDMLVAWQILPTIY